MVEEYSQEELTVLGNLFGLEEGQGRWAEDDLEHHPAHVSNGEEKNMPQTFNPWDASNDRDALSDFCLQVFKECPTYHHIFTSKVINMLSTPLLRHLTALLQELTDVEVALKRGGEDFQLEANNNDDFEDPDLTLSSDSSVQIITPNSETPNPMFTPPKDEKDAWADGIT